MYAAHLPSLYHAFTPPLPRPRPRQASPSCLLCARCSTWPMRTSTGWTASRVPCWPTSLARPTTAPLSSVPWPPRPSVCWRACVGEEGAPHAYPHQIASRQRHELCGASAPAPRCLERPPRPSSLRISLPAHTSVGREGSAEAGSQGSKREMMQPALLPHPPSSPPLPLLFPTPQPCL